MNLKNFSMKFSLICEFFYGEKKFKNKSPSLKDLFKTLKKIKEG
jgi:hypothetical protein